MISLIKIPVLFMTTEEEKIEITKYRGTSYRIDPRYREKGIDWLNATKPKCRLISILPIDNSTLRITWLDERERMDCELIPYK